MLGTTQKMKFSIKDLFSKCDQIRRKLRIWSYLLKKSVMGNFIFCAVRHEMGKHSNKKSNVDNRGNNIWNQRGTCFPELDLRSEYNQIKLKSIEK